MSNTWKARCVWVNKNTSTWNIRDIIEVINGTGVASDNYSHGFGGLTKDFLQSFDKWCEFQDEDFTKWELISERNPTLRDHINQLSNREFAEMIVDIDSDFEHYITTDDATWYDREDAIKHQIELLGGEYNE